MFSQVEGMLEQPVLAPAEASPIRSLSQKLRSEAVMLENRLRKKTPAAQATEDHGGSNEHSADEGALPASAVPSYAGVRDARAETDASPARPTEADGAGSNFAAAVAHGMAKDATEVRSLADMVRALSKLAHGCEVGRNSHARRLTPCTLRVRT